MAGNQWFRMYHEFATDPKVQMLSETDQRRFVMLLCMRCSNGCVTLQDEEVAFQLRLDIKDWLETKESLTSRSLIDKNNSPTAWDKRQFASDSSTTRVSRHRNKKKQACNVTETKCNVIDTDTDTDTDNRKSIKKKSPTHIPEGFKPSKANIAYAEKHGVDLDDTLDRFKAKTAAEGKQYVDWHAGLSTYLQNAKKWAVEASAKVAVNDSPKYPDFTPPDCSW